jgi:hypothetical protein
LSAVSDAVTLFLETIADAGVTLGFRTGTLKEKVRGLRVKQVEKIRSQFKKNLILYLYLSITVIAIMNLCNSKINNNINN